MPRTARRSYAIGLDIKVSPFTHRWDRSWTARSWAAACGTSRPCCTPRRCTSRMSRRPRGRTSSPRTSPAPSISWRKRAPPASPRPSSPARRAFGRALVPRGGAPAAWITEDVVPVPLNVYEVTKVPAEDLCELFHRSCSLPCLILRTSCFFPEPADRRERHGWPTRISTRRPTSSCWRADRGHRGRAPARARQGSHDRIRPIHAVSYACEG